MRRRMSSMFLSPAGRASAIGVIMLMSKFRSTDSIDHSESYDQDTLDSLYGKSLLPQYTLQPISNPWQLCCVSQNIDDHPGFRSRSSDTGLGKSQFF